MTTALTDCHAALNVFSRSANDLQRVLRVFLTAFRQSEPQDLINALADWIGEKPNFPTPAEIRPLVDERAKQRFDAAPRLKGPTKPAEKPVTLTFAERIALTERIHDGLAEIYGRSGKKMKLPRDEWVVSWARDSISNDCRAGRISNGTAAQFHRELDSYAAAGCITERPPINQADVWGDGVLF